MPEVAENRVAYGCLGVGGPCRAMADKALTLPRGAGTTGQRPLGEPLLDATRAAELLSVRPSWIYESVRSGRLPHLKLGRHIRFLRSDLEAWVLDQREWGGGQ